MTYTISSIAPICEDLRSKNSQLVLATGFFDLFHEEHQNFLTKAKSHGDIIVVAVESDARARKLKGKGRPIDTQQLRAKHVAEYADYVILLPDNFDNFEAYDSLMLAVMPDVYAVSSHTSYLENKKFLTEKYGGELVVVHPHNPSISTTTIINNHL